MFKVEFVNCEAMKNCMNDNFYRVWNTETGMIVAQCDSISECEEYIEENSSQLETFELSKSVMNLAAKNNKAVCLDWNVDLFSKAEALQMDYQATIVVYNDAEADHEGDAIYKVYKTDAGFKAVLWAVWTKELKDKFPQMFEGEKGLKSLLKKLG